MYINYEVLCNALATNIIDLSQAEIFELHNEDMNLKQLETLLEAQNEYTYEKFAFRFYQMNNLNNAEQSILSKDESAKHREEILRER